MSSKNNALLQDPEALFRTRIADPKLVARIEKLDSNKIAASAVMACFLRERFSQVRQPRSLVL